MRLPLTQEMFSLLLPQNCKCTSLCLLNVWHELASSRIKSFAKRSSLIGPLSASPPRSGFLAEHTLSVSYGMSLLLPKPKVYGFGKKPSSPTSRNVGNMTENERLPQCQHADETVPASRLPTHIVCRIMYQASRYRSYSC